MEKNIGTLIKLNRLMQNMTIAAIAKETNIDPSQISKIERGYETSANKTKKILDFLDIESHNIYHVMGEIECLSNNILEELYYHTNSQNFIKDITELNEICYTHFYTLDALTINLINHTFLNKNDELANKSISILETLYSSLSNTQKSIYLLCLALLHSQKSNMKLSKYYLEKSFLYITSDKIKSIYYYCSALVHLNMSDLFKSLEDINIAKSIFEKTSNYYKETECLLVKSQIAISSKSFQEATSLLIQIEKNNQRNFQSETLHIQILNLKLTILIKQEKFDDFLNFSKTLNESSLAKLEKEETYVINKILSYYYLEMYQECKSFCNYVKTFKFSILFDTLVEYFLLKTSPKKNSRKNISLLKKCLKLCSNNQNYYFYHILIDLLTLEYLNSKNIFKIYECYTLIK